jgi:alkylation response protein AidB-like acyl-CoA dehydrogenase
MYSFEPSEEQQMLIDTISRFSNVDLRPAAHEADEENQIPIDLIEKGWELGVLQASIPEEFGGFGEYSAVTGVLAAEEMAFGDLAGSLAVMTPCLFALPIMLVGSDEQKSKYLPAIVEAEWQPFTAALIEPKFDFDPNDVQTTAAAQDGSFLLNGGKSYVPFANEAEEMIIYANLDGQTQGFIVPTSADGLSVGERQLLLGIHGLPVYTVNLENVQVSKGNRLGGEDGHDFSPIIDSSRVALSALAVGMARAAFEYSRDYAKEREVFGVKVAQKQAIAFMLAEMATEIEAVRLTTWEAAWMIDNDKEDKSKHAYLAHIGATDMAMMVTDRAVQILGGYGYIREYPVELWMRNGRGIATFTGMAMV